MISGPEIAVIAIVVLLLFGPDKIPQILKTLKKAAGLYAEARDQVQDVVTSHVISPEELEMLKDPLGLNGGSAGSKSALLTPERKSLYSQTMPVPEVHVSDAPTPTTTPTPATNPEPAPSLEPTLSVESASDVAVAPASDPMPDLAKPTPAPAPTPTSAAASIWASLEQSPPVQEKDGS